MIERRSEPRLRSLLAGHISFNGRLWRVPQAFLAETLAIRPTQQDGKYTICFGAIPLATIDLNAPQ